MIYVVYCSVSIAFELTMIILVEGGGFVISLLWNNGYAYIMDNIVIYLLNYAHMYIQLDMYAYVILPTIIQQMDLINYFYSMHTAGLENDFHQHEDITLSGI